MGSVWDEPPSISVPVGLPDLLKNFAKAAIKQQVGQRYCAETHLSDKNTLQRNAVVLFSRSRQTSSPLARSTLMASVVTELCRQGHGPSCVSSSQARRQLGRVLSVPRLWSRCADP